MICQTCGGDVYWMGPLTALTHTECRSCGAVNNQESEDIAENASDPDFDGDFDG